MARTSPVRGSITIDTAPFALCLVTALASSVSVMNVRYLSMLSTTSLPAGFGASAAPSTAIAPPPVAQPRTGDAFRAAARRGQLDAIEAAARRARVPQDVSQRAVRVEAPRFARERHPRAARAP